MKRILITGACGQIGTELTETLRARYGADQVVASDIVNNPGQRMQLAGPYEQLDCTDYQAMKQVIENYQVDTIYHLAAILSATAENNPQNAWNININGLYQVLELAREKTCAVFTPSSIGAFGPSTPKRQTPQDTIQRPTTIYGVTKVAGELLCDYYHQRFGVDTRGVRYPGIISYKQLPGGGTTDYAVEIFYEAIKQNRYTSPIAQGSFMDMMYMPDAIQAAIDLMEADGSQLKHRNAFNVTAMSFDPELLAETIREFRPQFVMDYKVDPVKQAIADSWPDSLNDHAAQEEWGWKPKYNLKDMTKEMLDKVAEKLQVAP